MLSRRDLVGKLALGIAGMAGVVASRGRARAAVETRALRGRSGEEGPEAAEVVQTGAQQAQGVSEAPALPAPPPWELFEPLTLGATVAYGWQVADLSGPAGGGACVLTLKSEGGRVQRVHVCRNDGQPQGFVYTDRLDLVVMNGGRGDLGTEENLAQAVAVVARVVAANENRRDQAAVIDALLPHSERLRQFATANEWTLR